MKRKELIRRIEDEGAFFEEEGKKHTHYRNPRTKKLIAVPRHTEIHEGLSKKIIRDAAE